MFLHTSTRVTLPNRNKTEISKDEQCYGGTRSLTEAEIPRVKAGVTNDEPKEAVDPVTPWLKLWPLALFRAPVFRFVPSL
jgi:hypothetical protein